MKSGIIKHRFVIFFTAFFFIGISLPISAVQEDSLRFYLQLAAENNPAVMQKFYEYEAALQKIPQVGSLSDPELSTGIFLSPMELLGGKQVADIQLMQMFPWFGVLKNAKDEMSLMANAKFELFREAKLQVFYQVQSTWYNMYQINQDIRISEKNLDILKTLERIALVRYKTAPTGGTLQPSGGNMAGNTPATGSASSQNMQGMNGNTGNSQTNVQQPPMQTGNMGSTGSTGLADLYRIQIDIGNLENTISLLKSQFITIKAKFNALLNRQVKNPVSLPDSLEKETLETSLLAVSDSILSGNPMLAMLQYEKQSLGARKTMVKKMGYPMVGLGLNYSVIKKSEMSTAEMNGNDMIMPMVKFTLPIYRKKYKAMQKETDLMEDANEQNLQATSNSLQTEYFEAVQAYQDAERRIQLYKTQSQLANKSLDIMIKTYSASTSGASLTDILNIRQQTLDYEIKSIEAMVDFNTSVAWLKRLAGNFPLAEKPENPGKQ